MLFLRSQVGSFVTLFVERSGSTYLSTSLNAHPDVLSLREPLSDMKQRGCDGIEQLTWVREFLAPPLISRSRARGFKTKLIDIMEPEGFADLLRQNDCRIIQLQRRNTVKAAISTINARRLWEASGNWNLLNEEDRLSSFVIDEAELDHLLEERERWDADLERYVETLGLPTLQLFYEDLLLDEEEFISRVFDFIGVDTRPVRGRTIKNTSDKLSEVIKNIDDLRSRYAGTKYRPMFDEVLVESDQ